MNGWFRERKKKPNPKQSDLPKTSPKMVNPRDLELGMQKKKKEKKNPPLNGPHRCIRLITSIIQDTQALFVLSV